MLTRTINIPGLYITIDHHQ